MNIKDIASMAGVSISTVSKIINGKDDSINDATKEKVLKIVKEYNYTPYARFTKSTQRKSFTVAALLKYNTANSIFLDGLTEALEERGYHLLYLKNGRTPEEETKNIHFICSQNVDAVIWEPLDEESLVNYGNFEQNGLKVFLINCAYEKAFCIDYSKYASHAVKELFQAEHRTIALVHSQPSDMLDGIIKGYKMGLYDQSLTFNANLIYNYHHNELINYLNLHNITALITPDIRTALMIYKTLDACQRHIPDYISLIAINSSADQEPEFPEFSIIPVPYRDFGRFIANKAVDYCELNSLDEKNFIPDIPPINNVTIAQPALGREKNIIVLGSMNIDTTLNVKHFPKPNEASHTNNYSISVGGKGTNYAVGIARLKHNAILLGRLGNDSDADRIYSTLNSNRVNTAYIRRDQNEITGKAYIYVQEDGESTISTLDGANNTTDDLFVNNNASIFKGAQYCIISTEIPMSAVNQALKIAKMNNCITIVKPVALTSLDKLQTNLIDIFIPNRTEALRLSGNLTGPEEQGKHFLQYGFHSVIITLGSHGCFLMNDAESKYYDAAEFIPIDTTGGSDAFISTLVSYLQYGYSLNKAIQIANYAAGFCISRQGVITALADKASLESYISKVNNDLLKID